MFLFRLLFWPLCRLAPLSIGHRFNTYLLPVSKYRCNPETKVSLSPTYLWYYIKKIIFDGSYPLPYLRNLFIFTLNSIWRVSHSPKPESLLSKGLFIWRWAGPVRRASAPRWDDFYRMFIWNLLSQFNQKVCYVAGKRLFD